eukprot:gene24378-29627_t
MRVRHSWVWGGTPEEIHQFPDLVMEQQIDFVVLDQNLSEVIPDEPNADQYGTGILKLLRARGYTGDCITRTAHDSLSSRKAYFEAGFDDVLSKTGDIQKQLCDCWNDRCKRLSLQARQSSEEIDISLQKCVAAEHENIAGDPADRIEKNYDLTDVMHFARHSWEDAFWQENARLNRATVPAVRNVQVVGFISSLVMEDGLRCACVEFSVLTLSAIGVAFLARSSRVPDRWISAIDVLQCNVLYPGILSGFDAVVGKKDDQRILHEWQNWHMK